MKSKTMCAPIWYCSTCTVARFREDNKGDNSQIRTTVHLFNHKRMHTRPHLQRPEATARFPPKWLTANRQINRQTRWGEGFGCIDSDGGLSWGMLAEWFKILFTRVVDFLLDALHYWLVLVPKNELTYSAIFLCRHPYYATTAFDQYQVQC